MGKPPSPAALKIPAPDWSQAACFRAKDPDIFFDDDAEQRDLTTPQVHAYCSRCPILQACLNWALDSNQKHGMWGDTTPRARDKLKRVVTRVSCPGCMSQDIFEMPDEEICVSCGLSWKI